MASFSQDFDLGIHTIKLSTVSNMLKFLMKEWLEVSSIPHNIRSYSQEDMQAIYSPSTKEVKILNLSSVDIREFMPWTLESIWIQLKLYTISKEAYFANETPPIAPKVSTKTKT